MKKILFVLLFARMLVAQPQTINPNQIRPGTADGQVLTTVNANQPPSWQSAAAGVSVSAISPVLVNGGAGPVLSGDATISCPSCGVNFQLGYTQQGTGQYVLVFFGTGVCTSVSPGGACQASATQGSMDIRGGQGADIQWSNPQLPAGLSTANITAIYPFVFKTAIDDANSSLEETGQGFAGTGIGGCTPIRPNPGGARGPKGQTPLQFSCQISSGITNILNMVATAAGATNPFTGGGILGYPLIGMEVDYSGTPVVTPNTINLGPGLGWDEPTQTILNLPYQLFPLPVAQLPDSGGVGNPILVGDGSTTTDCTVGGGTNLVWCIPQGGGAYTGVPFTGSSSPGGITQLTGDVTTPSGSGSQPATLATVNTAPGSCTNCNMTVNAKGLVTSQSNGSTPLTNPMTTTGDMIVSTPGGTPSRLAGPTVGTVPYNLCSTPSGGVATVATWCLPGIGGRTVTGTTDTVVATDRGQVITYTSSSSTAATLTAASTLLSHFDYAANNAGTGTVTVTPGSGTINGSASLAISSGEWCAISSSDNTNYIARCASAGSSTPPGGSNGQIQYNNSGSFGGLTIGTGLTNNAGSLTTVGQQPAIIAATFVGVPANSQIILYAPIAVAMTVPSSCTGSLMKAATAATASTVFLVKDLTTSTTLCTATFASSGTSATFSGSGGSITVGDIVEIIGPATADATLATIGANILATR